MIKEFELTKNSGSEEIKKYFQKILELSKSGEKYPINLDDVWGLAYSQKRDAVRLLQGEQFIQDIDFTACQNGKVVNINSLANGIRSEINISVSCMEYLVARKVRSVFEVYRQVFHKIAEGKWVLPKNFSQALRLAADQYEQIEAQNKQIEALSDEVVELKKKTDYLEIILQSKETVTIGQIAADYGMTPQEMNGLLAKMHIQHKVNGQWLLYADYVRKGYTHSETIPITHKDGRAEVKMFSKWRQSGRIFLYNKLKERGINPLIEK